jgi:RHS repeat-associated protein
MHWGYRPAVRQDVSGRSFVYNLRLPGQYYDQKTGLNYNYFRDFDPSTGRYVESDPIGLATGVNTYAYVEDNPISGFDPLGRFNGVL